MIELALTIALALLIALVLLVAVAVLWPLILVAIVASVGGLWYMADRASFEAVVWTVMIGTWLGLVIGVVCTILGPNRSYRIGHRLGSIVRRWRSDASTARG